MSWDAPDDRGPLAEVEVDYDDEAEGGRQISPWTAIGIVLGLLAVLAVLVVLF